MSKSMNIKQVGGILMITGNAIGAGMLALPLATAQIGFINSTLFLLVCWAIMLIGGLLILEVNLWFPANSHLASMAHATLGRLGEIITWLCYLFLLYSLLCAYISGGSQILQGIFQKTDLHLSQMNAAILFVLGFGIVVYRGIRSVDRFNQLLMGMKLCIYMVLIVLILPFLLPKRLAQFQMPLLPHNLGIIITSFGFAAIIPSLRSYFHSDSRTLRRVIIIGSLIPLICYVLWNAAIMGIIPVEGHLGLAEIAQAAQPTNALTNKLGFLLENRLITTLTWGFASICFATSFLGVGLSLLDFLMDGLGLHRTRKNKNMVATLTFLPPLVLVLFLPKLFLAALNYAGIWCVSLLALLPALMAWSGRDGRQLGHFSYRVSGGKAVLSLIIVASSVIIIHSIIITIFL